MCDNPAMRVDERFGHPTWAELEELETKVEALEKELTEAEAKIEELRDEQKPDSESTSDASDVTSENARKVFKLLSDLSSDTNANVVACKDQLEAFIDGVRDLKIEHDKYGAALDKVRKMIDDSPSDLQTSQGPIARLAHFVQDVSIILDGVGKKAVGKE